jgi:hypothetical protein
MYMTSCAIVVPKAAIHTYVLWLEWTCLLLFSIRMDRRFRMKKVLELVAISNTQIKAVISGYEELNTVGKVPDKAGFLRRSVGLVLMIMSVLYMPLMIIIQPPQTILSAAIACYGLELVGAH